MIIDWCCPFCNDKHLNNTNFNDNSSNLSLTCSSCNKTSTFTIITKKILLSCTLDDNSGNLDNYSFTILK